MKYKKYSRIIILIFVLMIGINRVYAQEMVLTNQTELKYTENTNKKSESIIKQLANDTEEPEICGELFGDKDNPNSIRGLANEILMYPKFIVPILVILLGMIDLGKAVLASKEDQMKKAQSTFIKRVLIGTVIFFIPTILDFIMFFIDLVLGYTTCGL